MRVTIPSWTQDLFPYGYLAIATYSEGRLSRLFHLCTEEDLNRNELNSRHSQQACICQQVGNSAPIAYSTMLYSLEQPQVEERRFLTFQTHHEQTEFIQYCAQAKKPRWEVISQQINHTPITNPWEITAARELTKFKRIRLDSTNFPTGAILDSESLTLLQPETQLLSYLKDPIQAKYDLRAQGYSPLSLSQQLRTTTRKQLTQHPRPTAFLDYDSLRKLNLVIDNRQMHLVPPPQLKNYWQSLIAITRINLGLVPHSPFTPAHETIAYDPFNL
jgi:hypothetical protein